MDGTAGGRDLHELKTKMYYKNKNKKDIKIDLLTQIASDQK